MNAAFVSMATVPIEREKREMKQLGADFSFSTKWQMGLMVDSAKSVLETHT